LTSSREDKHPVTFRELMKKEACEVGKLPGGVLNYQLCLGVSVCAQGRRSADHVAQPSVPASRAFYMVATTGSCAAVVFLLSVVDHPER
jgi:hypothetical protein